MSKWEEYKLGELIEVTNGFAFKSENFLTVKSDKSLPVIKIKNVANGDVHLNECLYHKYDESLKKYLVGKNDILIALTGNHPEVMTQVVGETSRYKFKENALLNQRVAKIEARKNLDNDFLYYFLKDDSTHNYLASQSAGSANQANISKGNIEDLPINCPSLSEQHAIASILSSLDDKIELLYCQNKTLEQLAETLFRQWFVGPAHRCGEAVDDWEVGKLGDLLELIYGKGLKEELRTGSGFPVIGSSGVVGYHNEYLATGPGIVIGRKGTLGKVIYLYENFYPIDTTYFVKSKTNSTELLFEYFLLRSLNFEDMNSDSAVPGLNRDIALSTEILLPPEKKIKEFNKISSTLFQKRKFNMNQIRTLTQLRDTLLPKLMSGEVRVK